MRDLKVRYLAAATAALLGWGAADDTGAQKIVCWKDKAGKVVGCGDTVPPEFRDSATREIDAKSGITRRTTGTAEEEAARKAAARAKTKPEVSKVSAEEERQRRRDAALLGSYTNAGEIDMIRDRELAVVDGQINQLRAQQAKVTARLNEAKKKAEAKKSAETKQDLAEAEAEAERFNHSIVAKEKEKEGIRKRYAETRQRYVELSGGDAEAAKK